LGLLAAAFAKILADEFKAWSPTIVSAVVITASRIMPPTERDRAAEEWAADVADIPGDLSKILYALGLVVASLRRSEFAKGMQERGYNLAFSGRDRAFTVLALLALAPLMLATAIALAIVNWRAARSVLTRLTYSFENGKKIEILRFDADESTRLGRFLCRSSIDQIPAVFNVARGDLDLFQRRAAPRAGDSVEPPSLTGVFDIAGLARLAWSLVHISSTKEIYKGIKIEIVESQDGVGGLQATISSSAGRMLRLTAPIRSRPGKMFITANRFLHVQAAMVSVKQSIDANQIEIVSSSRVEPGAGELD
jgi:hypothetical protein